MRRLPLAHSRGSELRERSQRGNSLVETALFVPVLLTLLMGMVQFAKVTYTYYTLQKTLYSMARYIGTQQGVNFCDDADALVAAAKNFALTGRTEDGVGQPLIPQLTPDMLAVRMERVDPSSGALGECTCSVTGCDVSQGGLPPEWIVAYIPNGFEVQLLIPYLTIEPILLRPVVRVPYGGT